MTIDTGVLSIECAVHGPSTGKPVLLLHGWPDSPSTWDKVVPLLVAKGFRVIVPTLRGYGGTTFRMESEIRSGEPTALAHDALSVLEHLKIEKAIVVGHDWGARAAYTLAALWPHRVEKLVTLAVLYETGVPSGAALKYPQQREFWYQWFFQSERGREALLENRKQLAHDLWKLWSPQWNFAESEFEEAATAWENPDHVDVTLHSYRLRWGTAQPTQRYQGLELKMVLHPPIQMQTLQLHGEADHCILPSSLSDVGASFPGGVNRVMLPGCGHFIPRERPAEVAKAVEDVAG